ncbi:hypothetical protein ACQ4PT_010214 [Festuca glaucescens]
MAASVATGVMEPLLGKLTELLGEEYKKFTGVREQASFLRDELSAMKALLDKMELMDKLDPSAKNWRDHVREMSYDMENCIDDFMHNIDSAHAKPGFVKKMVSSSQHWGGVIKSPARLRSSRFLLWRPMLGVRGTRLMIASIRVPVLWPSIPGYPRSTRRQQDLLAFFSVSQRPYVKSLLIGLQRKLGIKESSHNHELQEIVDHVREYLKHKRYFILVDDVWDQSAWNIISCAFPENSNGSRVMVTTGLDDVALCACHSDPACIYKMKHLKEQDSRRLFQLGSDNVCPPQFEDISAEILKKCGGLPLAVITIASLLASNEARSLNEWKRIKNALGAKSATQPTLEEMRGILNLSYIHLPLHLRPCLLYLGMYPEDRDIYRDDLVRQWISEGFVCSSRGVDLEDVAKGYFNELINRSLIQHVHTQGGEVLYFRVHDMLLDLILSKSTTDNFISVAYNYEDLARLHSCEYKVRRLSLISSVGGAITEALATSMSQVRSYAQFGESKYIPHLSQFKYFKVLARGAKIVLPTEIKGLVHLETLELLCDSTQSFPSDINRLVNLFHLILPDGTALPEGIQNMKSVRTLNCSVMSESSLEDIKGLRELTNLKELILSTPYGQCLTVERADALVSSIGLLRDLKHLTLDCDSECDGYEKLSDSLSDPPPHLEVLDLETWKFSIVPGWIRELRCLRILKLCVLRLSGDDIRVLGKLPSLVYAIFRGLDVSQDKIVVSTGLFLVLEEVLFWSDEDVTAYLSFEAGAMPKLQKLILGFGWKEWMGATPVGMECLLCLQDIQLWPEGTGAESSKDQDDVLAAIESSFKSAASMHPGHPSVTFH